MCFGWGRTNPIASIRLITYVVSRIRSRSPVLWVTAFASSWYLKCSAFQSFLQAASTKEIQRTSSENETLR